MSAVKPTPTEYAPYYERYVSLVPQGDILETLGRQIEATLALLSSIPEEKGDYRYAPEKWSIKELLGHIIDTERIFAYRALRFGRNDSTELAGYEQDDYGKNNKLDGVSLSELAKEFESVRRSTIYLLQHFDEAAWSRNGVASNNPVSVRALAHIIAGHETHHLNVLRERYL
jgi:uncharacterized damage-inducible protein DinB